jgi:hypothetical protein
LPPRGVSKTEQKVSSGFPAVLKPQWSMKVKKRCVFRTIVTDRFGIVTAEFGNVTGHFGDVTDGAFALA